MTTSQANEYNANQYNANQEYRYTRLIFNGLNLLLFHNDTHYIEPADALSVDARTQHSVGRMSTGQGNLQAWCLNSQLELMEEMPLSRQVSVILPATNESVVIMCERAEVIESRVKRLSPLPECMRVGHTPVRYLSVFTSSVDLVMHANDLINHIAWLAHDKVDEHIARRAG